MAKKKKLIGKILILDSVRSFYLRDGGHTVCNFSPTSEDEIIELLMTSDFNLVIIPDDSLPEVERKLGLIPEQCRHLRVVIVSFFDLAPSREAVYRNMNITRFVNIKDVKEFVQDFLLLEEKEKKRAEEQKNKK